MGRDSSVYVTTPTAAGIPKINPAVERSMLPGSPPVAIRYVLASARKTAAVCATLMRLRFLAATSTAIMITFRFCSTVAVAELEYFTAPRNVYWHIRSPSSAKARSHMTSRRDVHILSMPLPSPGIAMMSSAIPESTMRIAVSHPESRSYSMKRYWLQTPDTPQPMLPVPEEAGLCGKRIDRQTRQGAEILDILRDMAEDFEEKAAGYEFEIAGNVLRIWKRLRSLLESDIRRETGSADDRFREMLMYLQRHYSGNITLDEIAAYTGISRSECCRYFRKKSGQTIFGYLNRYRIHKSMELLAGTNGDIAQIAQECGFSDQSYYTRKFREQTGMTPGQYRIMERQKEKPSP